jgi:hypothetical protein
MKLRQDAATAAAEAILWIEKYCGGGAYGDEEAAASAPAPTPGPAEEDDSLVCTTGFVSLWPGASNVIAGAANYSVDIRWGSLHHCMLTSPHCGADCFSGRWVTTHSLAPFQANVVPLESAVCLA